LDYRPPQAALKKAEDALKETSQCFDKAIAIAPSGPEIYIQRAGFMTVSNWENRVFNYYRGEEKIDPSKWLMTQFSKETIANVKEAAELSPENFGYIGLGASFEWMAAASQGNSTNFTRNMLPEASRQSIDNAMAQLGNLSQNQDPKIAAGALEYLGLLNVVSGNSQVAVADFRRAVALDPTREHCWDMLLGAVSQDSDFPDKAVAICKSRLKYKDSAQNHLSLAKAYIYKNEWSQAANEAGIAASLDTNNIVAPLMLTAIDLKQSANPAILSKAGEEFHRAFELYMRLGSTPDSFQRWREAMLNEAIFYGLQATPEGEKTAKACLDQVLKYYPNDETAKEILEALPGEGPSIEAHDD
jgi:tetratricopeptide (TPR) repeat protein